MRDYISAIRALMTKEGATSTSPHFSYSGAKFNIDYPAPPIRLAALGPNMIQVGAELTDGLVLNNSTVAHIQDIVRPIVVEHAKAAGRDPHEVKIQQGVRLVIDDDIRQRAASSLAARSVRCRCRRRARAARRISVMTCSRASRRSSRRCRR